MRIKAPRVAVGVLVAIVLLLSSVVSEDSSVDFATGELTIIDAINELPLMQLPFADRLRNTCDLQNDRTSTIMSIGSHRTHFQLQFLKDMLVYINFTKRRAQQVLQNQTINNCATLHIINLPHTPSPEELKEMDIKGALNKIYSSLLVHSGYSYFIYHQFVSSDIRCSEDIDGEQRLAEMARDLADKQRFLACRLQLGMKMLGYLEEDSSSVLNEKITDLTQCSLRALRDCQVMKSINNFLQIFKDYVCYYTSESTVTQRTVSDCISETATTQRSMS